MAVLAASGIVYRYRSSYGTSFDNSEVASPVQGAEARSSLILVTGGNTRNCKEC